MGHLTPERPTLGERAPPRDGMDADFSAAGPNLLFSFHKFFGFKAPEERVKCSQSR